MVRLTAKTIEERTQEIGRELLAGTRGTRAAGLSAKFWSDRLIAGSLENERFKTELFRFVDVFPVLKTPEQIHRHLLEYLQQPGVQLPAGMGLALKAGGMLKGTLARTVAGQVEQMARTFIAGKDLAEAAPVLEARWREGIAFSVDLLGEACVSHAEAAAYAERYRALIDALPALVAAWPAQPQLERDHLGPIPRANVSIKVSAMDGHVSPIDAEGSLDRLFGNLAPLLQLAAKNNVIINFDMEQHALKDLTIRLFKRCCERIDFPAGLALQAYLRTADEDARDLVEWARASGRIVTIRLIKGAYWDYESLHARMMNWPAPVWEHKDQTDACIERVTEYLLREMPRDAADAKRGGIKLALGTHNVRSAAHGIAVAESLDVPPNSLEFQALRGMADELKEALAARGFRVREYVPLGDMIPGMAYLVRRLLENTSNQGWLRAGQSSLSDDQLLVAPSRGSGDANVAHSAARYGQAVGHDRARDRQAPAGGPEPRDDGSSRPFLNEPQRDFSNPEARDAFARAVSTARVAPVPIDATITDAQKAISRATAAFPQWRDTPPAERAHIIRRAAALMREKRDALSAHIVLESHKTWAEADADVCEAIDFCEFYAREAEKLFTPRRLTSPTGEENEQLHEPRGTAAVIAPWNFSLSIPTGMTVAALVTGNAAILKPAEQTPAIARELCEILWRAGVPREVLHFLPGKGETVGSALVNDPRVAILAFTGSAAVGLGILRNAHARELAIPGGVDDGPGTIPGTMQDAAGRPAPLGVPLIPRVIAEMGGKNAIIIDDSADLDEAVLGTRQSAFSYAGQKCSAGSRVIVLDAIHDAFVARLVESTKALVLGDPRDPATDLGPVIDEEAAAKIRHYIDIGKAEATLLCPAPAEAIENQKSKIKNLIHPHIFTNVQPHHRVAREEIFGPVLAVMRAKDFDHALALANDSAYKLTGGLYSRTPSHLARARRDFRVGNLYLNRAITGALVGRQPFGGFGLSGTGTKAGGAEYLLHFVDTRIVTENTLRRGFAPDV